jgi:precorrin-2 dehydrogenase/sirohydrochlorin ferrochelatase
MRYYPVFLDINERRCVVVGGGKVAERKVFSLIEAGACVTVISPKVTKGIAALAHINGFRHVSRCFERGDLAGSALVISASSSKKVNGLVSAEADALGVPVNVVDDPASCSFIVPSVVDRDPLLIAISTSGFSPIVAKKLREALEMAIGPEYAVFVRLVGAIRNKLLKDGVKSARKVALLSSVIDSPLPEWIATGSEKEANACLRDLLGPGFTMTKLGVRL